VTRERAAWQVPAGFALLAATWAVAACGGDESPANATAPGSAASATAAPSQPARAVSAIAVELATNRARYRQGEEVGFRLTVRNSGSAPARIEFATGQRIDVTVDGAGGRAWQLSAGMVFTQALGELTLAPGASQSFDATWDQKDAAGKLVASGHYRAEGWLATTPRGATAVAEFDLDPP